MSKEIIQAGVQDDFVDQLWDAWRNGVECEVYVEKTGQWFSCYIREIDIDPFKRDVNQVEVVGKDFPYSGVLYGQEAYDRLHVPPCGVGAIGKTVDGSVVAIDGKKLLGGGNA